MAIKVKRISISKFVVMIQEGNKKMAFQFELTFGMRFSSRKLTIAIHELKSKFDSVGMEVYATEIYDKILEAYGRRLPPLLI